MKIAGRHYFCVFGDCGKNAAALDNPRRLEAAVKTAIRKAGMTLFGVHSKHFKPQGITLLAIIGESHVSVHTYPEHKTCVLDILTCGREGDPEKAAEALKKFFRPASVRVKKFSF